jgi:hypothetical protein
VEYTKRGKLHWLRFWTPILADVAVNAALLRMASLFRLGYTTGGFSMEQKYKAGWRETANSVGRDMRYALRAFGRAPA